MVEVAPRFYLAGGPFLHSAFSLQVFHGCIISSIGVFALFLLGFHFLVHGYSLALVVLHNSLICCVFFFVGLVFL